MQTDYCNWCQIKNWILIRFVYKLCTEWYGDSYADSDTCRRLLSQSLIFFRRKRESTSVFCILYSVICILYSVFCILYAVCCILYSPEGPRDKIENSEE
jgi:hypothetical protein